MAKRRETPDVLGEILGEIPAAASPPARPEAEEQTASQAITQPVGQPTSKPARKQAVKPAEQKARKPAAPPESTDGKVKATFYLSPATLDALEAGWLQLRRLASQENRGKVSKSLIVEIALQTALDELKAKDKESQLASVLSKQ